MSAARPIRAGRARRSLLAVIAALLAACAVAGRHPALAGDWPADAEPLQRFPAAVARIETPHGVHEFRTWIADTPARRSQGLMYVRQLDPDRAMYFPLGPPQWASFWMKNTYVSLDLLFIDERGRIVNVATSATPLSLEPITATAPVVAVLEVAAGTAARLHVGPGDYVKVAPPGQR